MAFSSEVVSDPAIVAFAKQADMPQLLNADEPTPGAEELAIPEASAFIAWLQKTEWGKRLEVDLQCLCEDMAGNPLLTSWLRVDDFAQLVADAGPTNFGERLHRALMSWGELGVTTVYVEGHQLTRLTSVPSAA